MLNTIPKIVVFDGGIGNQLFQLNYCIYLRNKGFKVFIDLSKYGKYNIHQGTLITSLVNIDFKLVKIFYKKGLLYKIIKQSDRFLKLFKVTIFEVGYYQELHYFINTDFKRYFWSKCLLEKKDVTKSSLGVHFRRGDYAEKNNHFLLDKKYYEEGIKLSKKVNVVIYTDDMECAKQELVVSRSISLGTRENSTVLSDFNDLMTHEYLLIANSSFSWMAAYLGKSKVVIAPKHWYYSLDTQLDAPRPEDWIYL